MGWLSFVLLEFGFFSPFLLSIPLPTGSQRNEQAAVWMISCWPVLPLNTALSSQALLWLGSTHIRAGLSSFQLLTQVQVPVTSPAWALMMPLRKQFTVQGMRAPGEGCEGTLTPPLGAGSRQQPGTRKQIISMKCRDWGWRECTISDEPLSLCRSQGSRSFLWYSHSWSMKITSLTCGETAWAQQKG